MNNKIVNPKIQGLVQQPAPAPKKTHGADKAAFAEVLRQQTQLKVSGHAQTRLQSRGISLRGEDWTRITNGVERAAAKGSRESLVMVDDIALVVSVKNRTVITAVAKDQLKENVFTNIDSAVFV